ncbi:uncharacterized mitochondrial protein-like protein, partial [Tanacetum coccineum]
MVVRMRWCYGGCGSGFGGGDGEWRVAVAVVVMVTRLSWGCGDDDDDDVMMMTMMMVVARGGEDRVDPEMRNVLCFGGKTRRKTFPAAARVAGAERRNRTLIEAARTMLADSKLPTTFWAEAVSTACYVEDSPNNENAEQDKFEDDSSTKDVNAAGQHVNTASPDVNTGSLKLNSSQTLEATHIEFFSDEDEPEVDLGNITNSYIVPTTPNTRIHKDHPIDNVIGDVKSSVQTRRMTKPTSEQGFLSDIKPTSIAKALSDSSWVEAMQEELLQFKLQQVWILVDLPSGKRAIGTKWVFKNKKDERGIMIRNKARLVAHGHRQEEGIDYEEVLSDMELLRKKSMYSNHLGIKEPTTRQSFKVQGTLMVCHHTKSMREVQQKEDGIFISQDKYVAEILKKFNYTDVKSTSTPVDLEKPLVKDGDSDDVDVHLYRSMIGSLMYLTTSRPDIMDSPFELVAYTGSDYAGATQDRKSTTGGCQFLGNRLISWQCKKQTVVATLKQTETEYVLCIVAVDKLVMRLSIRSWVTEWKGLPLLASELEAEHDMGIVDAQLSFEITSKQSNDPPLSRGYTLGSGEDKSNGFAEIIDFLKANSVHYALTVNSIIYTSCIEQFWATVKVQTVNGVRQLQALVDKKRVIITESSIRSDLHLDDAEGTDCLPTTTIFEELARMGSTMASLIKCLARTHKFNMSKYIFDAMVKHSDGGVKFLMYPRFLQVFINQQLGDMSHHKKIFVNPFHTKKVFANMKRAGKDFSGRITPLFYTMMVQASEEVGEDSDHLTNSNQIPIIHQPSTSSQPKQKQKSKRRQRKKAEVPQDETEHKESVPIPSNDPQSSGEDSMQLNDLMVLCTKLQAHVLNLEKAKDAQAKEIVALKKRVQRLEKKKKSRTTGLKRLKKAGMSIRVEYSEDQKSLGDHEDASKQGRSIEDIDADVEVT